MKKALTLTKKQEIAEKLLNGQSPESIAKDSNVNLNQVFLLFSDDKFSAKLLELFTISAKGLAWVGLNTIARIACDPKATPATKLKASKILADIGLNIKDKNPNGANPSEMTQSQLQNRLKELQREASIRAKAIKAEVIDQESPPNIDDLLD